MITQESILELHKQAAQLSVSMYLPTHKAEPEVQQDTIRYKNMLRDLEKELGERDADPEAVNSILERAKALVDDTEFWRHNEEGLAIFITPEFFTHFKVPIKFEQRFHVDEYFLITPLIRMITLEGTFCVLSLSQKNVRLLKCTRGSFEQIELSEAPSSMEEFRKFDVYQKSVQHHSGQGKGTAIFHGHGGGEDNNKVVTEYLKSIENEVTSILRKRHDPLILAGVDNAVAHYRKVNHYNRVMDEAITSNPDPMSDTALKDEGWKRIQSYFLKDMYEDLDRLGDLTESDKVSSDLGQIVEGAYYGKIDSLFIPASAEKWGVFEPELTEASGNGQVGPKNRDLINLAALFTLEKGGDVYAIGNETDVPFSKEIAAIYRYS